MSGRPTIHDGSRSGRCTAAGTCPGHRGVQARWPGQVRERPARRHPGAWTGRRPASRHIFLPCAVCSGPIPSRGEPGRHPAHVSNGGGSVETLLVTLGGSADPATTQRDVSPSGVPVQAHDNTEQSSRRGAGSSQVDGRRPNRRLGRTFRLCGGVILCLTLVWCAGCRSTGAPYSGRSTAAPATSATSTRSAELETAPATDAVPVGPGGPLFGDAATGATSTTTCGSQAVMAGVVAPYGTPLAACDGNVGQSPTPEIAVQVGQRLLFQFGNATDSATAGRGALRDIGLSVSVPASATIRGWSVTPTRAGTIVVSVTGWPCEPGRDEGAAPAACSLVSITAK